MFQQVAVSTNKIHEEEFLKVAVLNRSTKGAMTYSFRREYIYSLISAENEQK